MLFSVHLASVFAVLTVSAAAAVNNPAATRIRAHTTFLADDLMEGRGAGTRGFDLAARYVATQFALLGLEAGADDNSYLQPLKLLESLPNREAGRLIVHDGDKDYALTPITDMFTSVTAGQTSDTITAAAVFVGFAVQAPDLEHDDFAGVDLKGKIAVILSGAPKRFPSEQRAHHGHLDQKRALLVKYGAIGVVSLSTPWDEARRPWAMVAAQGRFPSMRLVDTEGKVLSGFPQLRVTGSVSHAAARRVLAGAPKAVEEIFATADRGESQNFPLPVSLTLAGESSMRAAESVNVLGWLPGSDPALAGDPLVITGHLDGFGVGKPVNSDPVYNGAIDNALGIGVLLHVAAELAAGPRLRRPVLFAAVTAEEKGLLGSRFLADHPPVRVRRYSATLNIDMPLLSAPARDLLAYGHRNSTLGRVLEEVAARHGLTVSPDPAPEEVRFVRSDQYSFVRKGVPSLKVDPGIQAVNPADDLVAAEADFRKNHYHKPSDDLSRGIDWAATTRYAVLMTDLAREIADNAEAAAWLPGDFFGELFGRKE